MGALTGKIAVVTGGGRGIGKAISLGLANAGAQVALTYCVDKNTAEDTVATIVATGGAARTMQMDVRDPESIRQTFHHINDEMGGMDILVNNAGINHPDDFDRITAADWDEIMTVNLRGPFLCSQQAVEWMKSDGGSIVNIGSVSGQYGGPRTAHYAASKAGLISLGQVTARYGAQFNIRCNTVAAGLIASDMAEDAMQHPAVKRAAEAVLLKRLGLPDEVARAVVFLAGDESSYITGQTVNVNGGLYF